MADEIMVTTEGLDKLKKELGECLKKRKIIADKIEYAKGLGDLSENFEYQEAKEDQSHNETHILELEDALKHAVLSAQSAQGVVNLGSKITVKSAGGKQEFQIVSFNEADPLKGKISNESPLGQAFLGRQAGEQVTVEVPRGKLTYEILTVE
ncbi:MAG: transcription elongation factor GreA [Patescibacteria group bacterium]|jgi:transcription elongation factor GreA